MYVAHAAFCVSVWDGNGLRMRIGKSFQCRQHSADDCLRLFVHGNVQLTRVSDTQAWTLLLVSDTHTQLFPFSRACFCVVKSPPNVSSISCHCALWAELRSPGRGPSMMPGGGIFCKKDSGEYGMLRQYHQRIYEYCISVFTSISVSDVVEISR